VFEAGSRIDAIPIRPDPCNMPRPMQAQREER
jgi:hypothetical protein